MYVITVVVKNVTEPEKKQSYLHAKFDQILGI